jgi:lipoyl-dependent peroxiredoxin
LRGRRVGARSGAERGTSGAHSGESDEAQSISQYSFSTRFADGIGTNPEELIAAAHAGCFSMALSAELGKAGIKPERIGTTATVTLDKDGGGFSITAVHLDVAVKIPGGDQAAFEKATADAKAGCPVSKVLNATITMDAKLET